MSESLEARLAKLEQLVADLAKFISPLTFNTDKERAMERVHASMAVGE